MPEENFALPASAKPELEVRTEQNPPPERPWPVVWLARSGTPGGTITEWRSEAIPAEEWRAPLLERVMRCAVALLRQERENARLRGDLLSIARRVGHDLRSPLGGILSTAELLSEELSETDPERAELTRPLFDSADALMKLVDRLSLIARSSARSEAPRRVRMEEAWWNARQRLERRMMNEGAVIVSEPDRWPEVRGVLTWIEAVWVNLLTNALQHGGKPARVAAGWEEAGGGMRRFWVRDEGKGVPEERRAGLFYPFHRLHEPGSPRGLGLSVAQHLTAMQGGSCGYEPEAEGGGRFYFILPGEEPETATRKSAPAMAGTSFGPIL